jgi:hypothetical protein
MIRLSQGRIRQLVHAFDRDETGSPWSRGERHMKARFARRRARGGLYLTRRELQWIGEWKSPRIRPQIARNTESGVRGVTAAAFLAEGDALQLELLLGLRGVGVAVASVILHFGHPDRYPIYDVRVRAALRRLGIRRRFPPTGEGWATYAAILRDLSRRHSVSLRTLDKALWQLGAS